MRSQIRLIDNVRASSLHMILLIASGRFMVGRTLPKDVSKAIMLKSDYGLTIRLERWWENRDEIQSEPYAE
jgi:hypothetical protein